MKIAAYQFKGSGNIEENLGAIERGILQAAGQQVRLLVTQECALCGYPPVETEAVKKIDFQQAGQAANRIAQLACQYQMNIALGTVLREKQRYTNSILLITPDGESHPIYHKRALWGWDRDAFIPGNELGVYPIDQIKIGFRICFEVRFPEYFRELFREGVELACVSLCDVAAEPNPARYELIKAHLQTRAVENAMVILSVNSISGCQAAPTCLIGPDGDVIAIAPLNEEYLLTFDYEKPLSNFGRDGRIQHSRDLLSID